MEKIKYVVLYIYDLELTALQQRGKSTMTNYPYKLFFSKIELEDWLVDEAYNIKGIRILEISKELKLKRDKVQLVDC